MPALSRFIRYFMAVGRLGSIRRAADELSVSASAIDRQILNAEARLGVQLFERLPTGLRLTAAGEVMMAAGGRWQKQLGDTLSQIEDLRGLKRGHVDIAVIDALAKGVMPAAIHAIQQGHPGITMGVHVLGNEQVRRAIAANDVDFGILFDPQSYQDLTVRAFVDVVLGIVSPPSHPLARKAEVRFSDCDGQSVILPAAPLAVHQQVAVLEATSGVSLHRRVTSDNIQMIASLIEAGDSIGILTSLDVSTEVRAGTLAFTRIVDKVLRPMTLALCTATARTPSYAAAMVLREIEACFTGFAYRPPGAPAAEA